MPSSQGSDSRKIEEKLSKEELIDYQTLMDAVQVMIAFKSKDDRFIMVNAAFAAFVGLPKEKIIGMTTFKLVKQQDVAQKVRDLDLEVMRTGKPVLNQLVKWSGFRSNNEIRVLSSKLPFYDSDGNIIGTISYIVDVEDRVCAEEKLAESEKHYRLLFDSIDEGFCIIEVLFDKDKKPVDYRFIEVNGSFEKQTGLSDALGRRMRELAPHHEEHWFEIYGKVALTGEPVRFTNRAAQLGRWYDVYAFRYGEPESNQVAILFNDISERKHSEAQAEESEHLQSELLEKFNEAQHVASIGSWDWNLKTNVVWWSDETYRIFGVNPQDFVPGFETNARFIHPDDLDAYRKAFDHSIQTGALLDCEFRLIAGDGALKFCNARGKCLFDKYGQGFRFTGTIIDHTQRQESAFALIKSEERYCSLFENMHEGFAYCKMIFNNDFPVDFIYLSTNQKFEKLTGLKDVVGKKVTEVIPGFPETNPELVALYGRVALTAQPEQTESYLPLLDMWLSISVYSDKKDFFYVVFDVITERKFAEEKNMQSYEQLTQLYKHLSEVREEERAYISREIHDELGQALTALKIDLSWTLEQSFLKPGVSRKIETMLQVVNNTIKNVQRISSDLRPGMLDDLGLAPAIEWYADEFEKRTGVKCSLDLEEVQLDDPKKNLAMFRILQEALTNVIRHAKAENVDIKLCIQEEEVHLTVYDDGIGMPKEKMDSRDSLGLRGMSERIRQFHGRFEIASQINEGTTLNITIPI